MKPSSLSTKVVDHLGLVSGMCEELDLVNQIDKHIMQDTSQREASAGMPCKVLIINELYFAERRLYMASSFLLTNSHSELFLVKSSKYVFTFLSGCKGSFHIFSSLLP